MTDRTSAAQTHNFLTTLKKHFGYDAFRPLQEEIIKQVMQGNDALVLMPTGGGKSMCFQLPALMREGTTLVISPLISLMKDQVDAFNANGVAAAFLNSSLDAASIHEMQRQVQSGKIKLLYLAPERLALRHFREWLQNINITLIAIDEAHCISEWGHDFRPDYRNLVTLRRDFPETPIIALTATATKQVREDIVRQLALRKYRTFLSSFNRPNLRYDVYPKQQAFATLVGLLQQDQIGSTIIYCFSRKGTEDLAKRLALNGFSALPYHAGLVPLIRRKTQERFIRDEVRIIVATIAFGMGIDKPDVRLIVHYDLPKSIEGYYQETGRAGRDSLPSRCVLLYSYGDTVKHRFFTQKIEDRDERDRAEEQLRQVVKYAETKTCRRKFLLRYFGEDPTKVACARCDICLPNALPAIEQSNAAPKYDRELFEQLRRLRKSLADARGVPPFVIFGDRSLQDMAAYFPQSLENFSQAHGVGQSKLQSFGKIFLSAIQQYAQKQGISEKPRTAIRKVRPSVSLVGATHEATRALLERKLPLAEIADRRGFTVSTILNHIEILSTNGGSVDLVYLRPDNKQLEKIHKAFQKSKGWSLAPVRKLLGESISYNEIRLARIFLEKDK
ncbi:MAG: RecQ family ATP-dependent DNA helicase [bacterium]